MMVAMLVTCLLSQFCSIVVVHISYVDFLSQIFYVLNSCVYCTFGHVDYSFLAQLRRSPCYTSPMVAVGGCSKCLLSQCLCDFGFEIRKICYV